MGQRPKLLNFSTLSEGREYQINNPIGYRKDGRPILLIAGGSGEDDDDDDDDTSGATVPIAKYLKTQNRMKAADRRANTAEARVAELEPIAARVPDLEKQVEAEKGRVKKLLIDNAFLTSDVDWVDAEAALRLVDLSEVTISDDGKVKGLDDALKALAEKKPYLVKPKADEEKGGKNKKDNGDDDDEDDEDEDLEDDDTDDQDDTEDSTSGGTKGAQNGRQGGGVSGTSTGSGKRRRGSKGPTDEELMRRYRI